MVFLVPRSVADRDVDVRRRLADAVAAPLGTCREALQRRALLDVDRLDLELVDVGAVVVLGVGDRRFERLLDDRGGLLLPGGTRSLNRRRDVMVDERALLERTSHVVSLLLLPARDNHRLRALVVARAITLGKRLPRRDRRLALARAAFAAAVRVVDRV